MPRKVEVHRIDGVLHATAGYRTFAYCHYSYTTEDWQDIWRKLPTGAVLTCLWCWAHILGKAWVRPCWHGVTHEAYATNYAMETRCGIDIVVDPALHWHEVEEMASTPDATTTCLE